MSVHNSYQASQAAKGGLIAGLWAGLLLSLLLAVFSMAQGQDLWASLKFAGVPLMGERALEPGFDARAISIGVLSHFAVSVGWAVLFGLLFYGFSRNATVLAGLAWGVAVWIGMLYVVMPLLGFPAGGTMPLLLSLTTHLLFGVTVGAAFLPYQRTLPRAPRQRTSP